MLASLTLCIAIAASRYKIVPSQITSVIQAHHQGGIGITGIPRAWLPYLAQAGFQVDALGRDGCQDVIAAGWILGYTQELQQAKPPFDQESVKVGRGLPPAAKAWQPYVRWVSAQAGLPTALVNAVIQQESRFRPNALGPKTKTGERAVGLMQILPSTARALRVNPCNPLQNIWGGTWYLSNLVRNYGGDFALALAAYNAGQGAVAKYGGIPPYSETREYVPTILRRAARYAAVNPP